MRSQRRRTPHAREPWAIYYLNQNPGWWKAADGYSRWKLGGSRKATAIETWKQRETAREIYELRHGDNPQGWPTPHPTVLVWPTNLPEAVCLNCLWIDGSHWEEPGARSAGQLHTVTEVLARERGQRS